MREMEPTFVDGRDGALAMRTARDINRAIEACAAVATSNVLLPASSLPPGFFDVSSGEAGELLQKLRNYRMRLAILRDDSVSPSTRFHELMADERRQGFFGLFDTEADALAWLRAGG